MKSEAKRGRIHVYLLAAMALILGLIATVRAVDLNHDLLDDAWGTQYGFTSTAISSGDLVGWWQMDDSSYSDVRDRSGNALHGTMANFPGSPFSAGLFYDGLSFDSDAYADFSGSALNLSSAFTLSLWFKGDTSSYKTTLARWEGSNGCLWDLGVTAGGVTQLTFVDSSSNVTTVASTIGTGAVDVRDDAWHHLAAVYDSTSGVARVYVDGVEEANDSVTGWTFSTATSFVLGNPPGDPANGDFQMDEARLYDVVISAGDIVSLPPTFWDADGDSLSNLAEYLGGTNPILSDTDGDGTQDGSDTYPLDYYNNALPTVSIVSGNFQRGSLNAFLSSALVLEVRDSSNNLLVNAPVSLSVTSSSSQISFANTGTGLGSTLNGVTDSNGRITFYAKFPATGPVGAAIQAVATSGANQAKVSFFATTEDLPFSGLKMWLRADLGVEKDGSNKVNRWIDQSGESNDVLQGDSERQPLWNDDGLMGKPTIEFDGSNDSLAASGISGSSASTVIVVYDKPAAGGSSWQRLYSSSSSSQLDVYNNGIYFVPETDSAGNGVTPGALITIQTDSNSRDLSNFHVATTNSTSYGEQPYYGKISEVIVYDRVLDAEEQADVKRALMARYEFPITRVIPSLASAVIDDDVDVTLSAVELFEDATIRYTLDGSDPTVDSSNPSSVTYSGTAIPITATTTLKVKIFESGFVPSETSTFIYTFDAASADVPRDGLKMWLRGDLGISKDGSDKVNIWSDQSGAWNDMVQTDTGRQPLWNDDGLNGHETLEFDGSNDTLAALGISGSSPVTVVVLYDKPVNGGVWDQRVYSSSAKNQLDQYNNGIYLIPQTDYYGSGVSDGYQIHIQTNSSNKDLSNFHVGSTNSTAYGDMPFYGKVSEVLVYDRVLDAGEQTAIRRHLAARYGFPLPKAGASTGTAVISGTTNITLTPGLDYSGATIRYTLDGSEPTEDSSNPNTLTYTGSPISITATTTLKVKIFESGFVESETATFVYTLASDSADVSRDGLKMWLRADLGVVKDGSGYVSEWSDQSGSGNDIVQAASGRKPLWKDDDLNGHETISFDGSDDYLAAAGISGNTPATVIVVYDKPVWGGYDNQRVYSSAYYEERDLYNNGVYLIAETNYYGSGVTPGPLVNIQTYSSNKSLANFHLGSINRVRPTYSEEQFCGNISEILVYNRVLDEEEQIDIKRDLAARYEFPIPKAVASIGTAVIAGTTAVTLSVDETFENAEIRYTLDGSEPTEDSSNPSTLTYTGSALSISSSTTLKVKIFESGFVPSETATFVYTLETASADVPRTGLKMWLRADLGVEKDGSNYVDQWNDQSGLGNDMVQAESARRPVWQGNGLNGQATLIFDGTDDYLGTAGIIGTSPATVIVVYDKPFLGGDGNQRVYSSSSYAERDQYNNGVYLAPEVNGAGMTPEPLLNVQTYTGNMDLSNFHVGSKNRTRVGVNEEQFLGNISEVIVYDRVLDEEELVAVEIYLYQRLSVFRDHTDSDGDGLADFQELVGGTDPEVVDTNGDGIGDGISVDLGLDPLETDMDGDGISNVDEIAAGTNPFLADSDYDGHDDGEDAYALDPSRWGLPASDPGDTTPPTLTLIKPVDAVLVP